MIAFGLRLEGVFLAFSKVLGNTSDLKMDAGDVLRRRRGVAAIAPGLLNGASAVVGVDVAVWVVAFDPVEVAATDGGEGRLGDGFV